MFSCMHAMNIYVGFTELGEAYALEIAVDDGGLHGMQALQPTCDVKQLVEVGDHVLLEPTGRTKGKRGTSGFWDRYTDKFPFVIHGETMQILGTPSSSKLVTP